MNYLSESEESEYDSSVQEQQHKLCSVNIENVASKANTKINVTNVVKDKKKVVILEQQEQMLKPKFIVNDNKSAVTSSNLNQQKTIANSSKISIKQLTSAYTFKTKQPQTKPKKHDPVSLYNMAKNSWANTKFLKNRADLKEGRKLALHASSTFNLQAKKRPVSARIV